jgi:hypothetical protein
VRDRQDHSKFAYQLYDGNNDGLAIVPYHNPEMPHIVFRAAVIKHSGDDEWFFNIKPEIKTVSNLRYSYLEAKTPGVHMYSDFYTAVRCLWTTAAIFGDVLLAKQELAQKH